MEKGKSPNKSNSEKLAEMTAEKQLEKLNLEIEQMKNKSKWHDRVTPYISLLTVAITVGGLMFSIYQFQNQQEKISEQNALEKERFFYNQQKERSDDIQKRYENSLDKLLQFTRDEKITSATAINLLTNLKTQIRDKAAIKQYDKNPTPELIAEEEKRVTRTVSYMLAELIKYDCNLDNYRDVSFVSAILYNWEDFKMFLDQNPYDIEVILDEHENALERIYNMDNSVIKEVTYDDNDQFFNYPNDYGKIDPAKISQFHSIIDNYKVLYDLLDNDKTRKKMLLKFQAAVCNKELTQQYFGESLEPEGRDEFNRCTKE